MTDDAPFSRPAQSDPPEVSPHLGTSGGPPISAEAVGDPLPAWSDLDRSDWPEMRSPDFGGSYPDGTPIMLAVCPGCGLYRDNDESPDDHFDDLGPCSWVASHIGGGARP